MKLKCEQAPETVALDVHSYNISIDAKENSEISNASLLINERFQFSMDVGCTPKGKCTDETDGINYQLWLSHYFLNNDNELVARTLNYETSRINQLWSVEARPILY